MPGERARQEDRGRRRFGFSISLRTLLELVAVVAVLAAFWRMRAPRDQIEPGNVVYVDVWGTLSGQPIIGHYRVAPDGTIHLGEPYGAVSVAGLTAAQAQTAVTTHLEKPLVKPEVTVELVSRYVGPRVDDHVRKLEQEVVRLIQENVELRRRLTDR